MTTYLFKIIALLGGLSLFLFGMDVMGKSLERQAGGKLQTILAKMSGKVWKGFLLGAAACTPVAITGAGALPQVEYLGGAILCGFYNANQLLHLIPLQTASGSVLR